MKAKTLWSNKNLKDVIDFSKEKGRVDLGIEFYRQVLVYRGLARDKDVVQKRVVKAHKECLNDLNNEEKEKIYYDMLLEYVAVDDQRAKAKLECQRLYGLILC